MRDPELDQRGFAGGLAHGEDRNRLTALRQIGERPGEPLKPGLDDKHELERPTHAADRVCVHSIQFIERLRPLRHRDHHRDARV